jgi:putative ABC transport system substrate-binding protein
MRRREFISLLGGAAAASSASWPRAAQAQQSRRVRRLGVLMNGTGTEPTFRSYLNVFTETLQKIGWSERADFRIDVRWTGADVDGIRTHAMDLVGLAPDLILASSSGNLATVLRATRSIPVIFVIVSDPVAQGFVASLARPGDKHHRFWRLRSLDRRQMG